MASSRASADVDVTAGAPVPDDSVPDERIVLVGMMAVGKTTVGRALAAHRDWAFWDSDGQVETWTGRTVGEIWATDGEAAFRRLESEALAAALVDPAPAVVAAAGGVVLDPANRTRLRRASTVVWLRARPETLAARVGDGAGPRSAGHIGGHGHRPLLGTTPAAVLATLDAQRRPLYEEVADLVVDVDDKGVDAVVAEVEAALARREGGAGERGGNLTTVRVELGPRSYPVVVGPGARHRLSAAVPAGARRAAVVTQARVPVTVDPGVHHERFLIDDGEDAKRLATVEELCRAFTRFGLTRADVVVAVGGGVVTDVAGFAAAVHHRGVPVVHVATTLLGQVDAAIGGKTGVNLPEGKNLVGAFWQPAAVLCDTEVLATLPPEEYRSGLGELAKYHFIDEGGPFVDLPLADTVARCVAIKARFVAADEREHPASMSAPSTRSRALLNYGHTLAHALETAGHYDLRHGEAVAVGLVFAARLARRLGRIDDARVAEHLAVVSGYALPTSLPPGHDPDELVELMARDKKAVAGLTFVLDGPGGLDVVDDVHRADVLTALAETAP